MSVILAKNHAASLLEGLLQKNGLAAEPVMCQQLLEAIGDYVVERLNDDAVRREDTRILEARHNTDTSHGAKYDQG